MNISDHRSPIDAVIRINQGFGKHFFDKDTMRFFDSKVPHNEAFISGDGRTYYFISSEQFHSPTTGESAKRKFTVHALDVSTGDVSDIGEFQQHDTYASARKSLDRAVEGSCERCGKKMTDTIEGDPSRTVSGGLKPADKRKIESIRQSEKSFSKEYLGR